MWQDKISDKIPTALTEAESISIAAWASNTLKCSFHTTHAAKQQAWQMENRQLVFSMLDDSGRKEVLEKKKKMILSFHKEHRGLLLYADLAWKFLIFLGVFAADTHQEPGSSVVVWREPQMAERGERRPHRLHLPPPVLLMDYQAFSCPSAKKRNPSMGWCLDCNHRRNGSS